MLDRGFHDSRGDLVAGIGNLEHQGRQSRQPGWRLRHGSCDDLRRVLFGLELGTQRRRELGSRPSTVEGGEHGVQCPARDPEAAAVVAQQPPGSVGGGDCGERTDAGRRRPGARDQNHPVRFGAAAGESHFHVGVDAYRAREAGRGGSGSHRLRRLRRGAKTSKTGDHGFDVGRLDPRLPQALGEARGQPGGELIGRHGQRITRRPVGRSQNDLVGGLDDDRPRRGAARVHADHESHRHLHRPVPDAPA